MRMIVSDTAVRHGRRTAPTGFVLIVAGPVGGLYVPHKLGRVFAGQLRPATPAVSTRP